MSKRKRAATLVAALTIICALIIWHAINWHVTGMYLEMFRWLGTGKGYLTVLYNLGLMLVLGIVLSLLMDNIARVISKE